MFVNAATLVCLRHRSTPSGLRWEVLMGQSEVVNWLRSSADRLAFMRYGGEFKFAGGTCDVGESLQETACRELREEFGLSVPTEKVVLHPFNIKQTKEVKGQRYRMHNFVVLSSENPWLETLDVDAVNQDLAAKRADFQKLCASGEYWRLPSDSQRAKVAPEVFRVDWLDISSASETARTSLDNKLIPVNAWQAHQFHIYGITQRDRNPSDTSVYLLPKD
eukprot:NODE_6207_length_869_cov_96.658177_g5975_i0.p1 GENE.NODE_6207_length_869_cov_96.658177_g5975_i0~~NODE_6207_length_869_cov_96.658177_g5975_i0.p1  ORF type:complete len:220 (-),score=20.85 NODE_6207_length_869_cov_96.658177_g5975_i0:154-813(-)